MPVPQIWPTNPILRKPSDPVVDFWDSLVFSTINFMRAVMQKYGGVGISAPQVWINKQIILVTSWKNKNTKRLYDGEIVMINPHILYHSDAMCVSEEWCVSLPGIFGKVLRYNKITVCYNDIWWKKHKNTYTDFTSYIIQHEIDHLEGILFVDKMIEEIKKEENL